MKILFVDPVCNKQYDPKVLATEPLGGSEASVIRVAEALALSGDSVRVTQHNRGERSSHGATYTPFKDNTDFTPTHIVVLRAPQVLRTARKQYPSAKLYLWTHDLFSPEGWVDGFQAVLDTQAVIINVSDFHRTQMYEVAKSINFKGELAARRIYNPIDDDLRPDGTQVDPDKLIYFSSPHKGLQRTIEVFNQFKNFKELRDMKLYVANPGYFPNADTPSNITNLGALPHSDVIRHVRSSLGILHLNSVFPETMGIVHAEGNAVGTPFLSSRLGATPEICDHPGEMIDVTDNKAVIERIIQWRTLSRPKVRGQPSFRMYKVIREWKELLKL